MLTEKELRRRAVDELIRVFGRKYLQDNFKNTCQAYGMVNDDTYQLFIGIKGFDDLPHRKANAKGWVVYGVAFIDANTGELKRIEYELE